LKEGREKSEREKEREEDIHKVFLSIAVPF
jgi:hypothetical protein